MTKSASLAQNEKGERVIKITFPYDPDMLMKIRFLPGRKWHPDNKAWSVPVSLNTIEQLQKWNFTIDEKLLSFAEKEAIMNAKSIFNG